MYSLFLNGDFDTEASLTFNHSSQRKLGDQQTNSVGASAWRTWTFFSLWLTIQEPFGNGPQIFQWREVGSWCIVVLNCEKVNCVKEEPNLIWLSDFTFNSICGLLCIRAQAKMWGVQRKSLTPQEPCSVTSQSYPNSHCPSFPSYTELWDLLGIRLFLTYSPLLFDSFIESCPKDIVMPQLLDWESLVPVYFSKLYLL